MKTFTTHLPKQFASYNAPSEYIFTWQIDDRDPSLIHIMIEDAFGIMCMDSMIVTRLNDDGTISPKADNIEMCIAVPDGHDPEEVSYEIDPDVAAQQLKKIVIPVVQKMFPLVSA